MTNSERARQAAELIAAQVNRGVAKGAKAMQVFLVARVKETLSVAAPRKAVRAAPEPGKKKGAILYYRATTKAEKEAPPRLLSGAMRMKFGGTVIGGNSIILGDNARGKPSKNYPTGYQYPEHHEIEQTDKPSSGKHKYIKPTLVKWEKDLLKILGGSLVEELSRKRRK